MASNQRCRRGEKNLFFVFNFILWALGLGPLLIGLWFYLAKDTYFDTILSYHGTLSAVGICILAGFTVIVITFLGCLGVWIESNVLLIAYVFFVFLLLTVQFVASAIVLNYHTTIYRHVRTDMKYSLKHRAVVFTNSRLTWDNLQKMFSCCGIDGPADWLDNHKWSNTSYVPDSCCNKIHFKPNSSMTDCGKDKLNWDLLFQHGCSEVYTNWVFEEIKIAGYVVAVFICIEFFLIVLVFVIFRSVRGIRMSYNCVSSTCNYSKEFGIESQDKFMDSFSLP